jgi:hypothetical protein
MKRENEHSEEWLNDFSQKLRAVALELTAAEEAEEKKKKMSILRNGSHIFSHEAEKTATWELQKRGEQKKKEMELKEDWLNIQGQQEN